MEKGNKQRNYDADLFFRRSQKAFEIVLVQTFRIPHSICDTYIHTKSMFVLLFERAEELS